jgi:dienelactone hydrolase
VRHDRSGSSVPIPLSGAGGSESAVSVLLAAPRTARIEIHSFESLTATDKQFLTGAKRGERVQIGGALRLPPGSQRFPAVILVHGSAGIGAQVDRWANELNVLGVAAFLLDSFTGREIVETITDQTRLGHLTMIVDAYRALQLLSKHPRIDPSRVAVMGFSKGGFAALYTSLERFLRIHGTPGLEFAAHIAFYPMCNTEFLEDEKVSDRPIRIFHGGADNYVSIDFSRKYASRLQGAGKDVQLTELAGAPHAFDNPLYSPPKFLADAVTTIHCSRRERSPGEIINCDTGQPFRWSDTCVKRGATVGFDPAATAEASKAVKKFLTIAFKLQS